MSRSYYVSINGARDTAHNHQKLKVAFHHNWSAFHHEISGDLFGLLISHGNEEEIAEVIRAAVPEAEGICYYEEPTYYSPEPEPEEQGQDPHEPEPDPHEPSPSYDGPDLITDLLEDAATTDPTD